MLGIMCAITTLVPKVSPRRLFAAGVLLGIASFFTHTHGFVALIAVSVFLKISNDSNHSWGNFWRMERLLLAGFTVVFLSLNLYFIATAGLKALLAKRSGGPGGASFPLGLGSDRPARLEALAPQV